MTEDEKLMTVDIAENIEVLDKDEQDFLQEIPEDWDDCIGIIKNNMAIAVKKSVSLFWYTGRILDDLSNRDAEALGEVAEDTGYGERSLYYMMAIYRTFPSYDTINTFIKHGISWSSIKELSRIKDEKDKADTVERISRDEIKSDDIPEYVQNLLEAPKDTKEEKEEQGEDNIEENKEEEEKDVSQDELFNWLVKLRDNYIEARTGMQVNLSDINEKIDQMDDTTKTDDSVYQKCVGVLEEIKDEADKTIKYFEQVKELIDGR